MIVLDIEDIDPTLTDPHWLVDELLDENLPPFQADEPWHFTDGDVRLRGSFVSAEWAPEAGVVYLPGV